MHIHFFEDQLTSRFQPLNLTRPTDDLRTGILTIRDKWLKTLKTVSYSRNLKSYMQKVFKSGENTTGNAVLVINSRYLPDQKTCDAISQLTDRQALTDSQYLIAAVINSDELELFSSNKADLNSFSTNEWSHARSIENIWDLLVHNEDEIVNDIKILNPHSADPKNYPEDLIIKGKENCFIGNNVSIEPGVIIMAEEGPVYIGDDATIEAGAILKGPVSIGAGSVVKMKARIYGGTSIGPVCKVAGEISGSIFHSYSNKAHEGYVGDSILGQWCNLGADTNTSNLKNNYSPVRIKDWVTGEDTETGQQFLGTIMGDHSKTAINTMLNTGTICGVSSNIFTSGFPPKFIPSFSWLGDDGIQTYLPKKALEAMEAMMKRRKINLSEDYTSMIMHLFENR
ncbi:putative sugar nucleotidyl transferase [Balneola sp. MJW-20]|uniref:putative sugar nucleotidyl transferase n=1 Tax=Gracilimonas aurantiaca TaxID=3234185 RepID=UPI0034662291